MREYVGIVRAILRGEDAPQDAEKWRTGFRLAMEHRPDVKILVAVGSEDDVQAGVQRYRDAGATSPCVGPIPHTDFEATLHAAAGR